MNLAVLATAATGGGGIANLAVFAVFGIAMWFLLIRPQRKRQKEQQELVSSLAVGDDIVTIGGLHGSVDDLGDDYVDLVVDADGTVLRFQRSAVARVVSGSDGDAADEVEAADEAEG